MTGEPLVDPVILERVLRRALARGGEFAEAYVEERCSHGLSSDDGKAERITSGVQRGLGLRLVAGGVTAYAYAEDLAEDSLLSVADQLSQAVRSAATSDPWVCLPPAVGSPAPVPQAADWAKAGRVALLAEADAAARSVGPEIVQVTTFIGTSTQRVQIANSEGLHVLDVRRRLRVRVQAVARHPRTGELAVGTYAPGVTAGMEFLEQCPIAEIARRAARQALVQLDAVPAPAGPMPVVLGNGVGGVLVHEACGHGLEGDVVLREASVYAALLGERIAADHVTIVDDSTVPAAWGSFGCDDEGEPARCTVLVEKGVLRSFLHDRTTAARTGAARTGNGRRASFRHLPLPRMSNTFVLPGDFHPDEIIAATPYGLYAKALSGGSVNPVNGNFQFTVREAYMIRGGRLAEPVKGATLVGRAPDVLRQIDLIGHDLDFGAGNCGKDGQKAMVGVGQPTLRIRELLVGGSAGQRG